MYEEILKRLDIPEFSGLIPEAQLLREEGALIRSSDSEYSSFSDRKRFELGFRADILIPKVNSVYAPLYSRGVDKKNLKVLITLENKRRYPGYNFADALDFLEIAPPTSLKKAIERSRNVKVHIKYENERATNKLLSVISARRDLFESLRAEAFKRFPGLLEANLLNFARISEKLSLARSYEVKIREKKDSGRDFSRLLKEYREIV